MSSYVLTAKEAAERADLWEQVKRGEIEVEGLSSATGKRKIYILSEALGQGKEGLYYFKEKVYLTHIPFHANDPFHAHPPEAQNVSEASSAPADSLVERNWEIIVLTDERDHARRERDMYKAILERMGPFFDQMQQWAADGITDSQPSDKHDEVALRYIRQLHAAAQAVLDDLAAVGVEPIHADQLRRLLPPTTTTKGTADDHA